MTRFNPIASCPRRRSVHYYRQLVSPESAVAASGYSKIRRGASARTDHGRKRGSCNRRPRCLAGKALRSKENGSRLCCPRGWRGAITQLKGFCLARCLPLLCVLLDDVLPVRLRRAHKCSRVELPPETVALRKPRKRRFHTAGVPGASNPLGDKSADRNFCKSVGGNPSVSDSARPYLRHPIWPWPERLYMEKAIAIRAAA